MAAIDGSSSDHSSQNQQQLQQEKEEELVKALSCCVCLDLFDSPKFLPSCGHSVCQDCIEKLLDPMKQSISCPECSRLNVIANGDVSSMKTNYSIQHAVEVLKNTQPSATPTCPSESQICDKLKEDIKYLLERRRTMTRKTLPDLMDTVTKRMDDHVMRLVDRVKTCNLELEEELLALLRHREERLVKMVHDSGAAQLAKLRNDIERTCQTAGNQIPANAVESVLRENYPATSLFTIYDQLVFEDERFSSLVREIEKEGIGGRLLLFHDHSAVVEAVDEALFNTSNSVVVKWAGHLTFEESVGLLHLAAKGGDFTTVQEICDGPMPNAAPKRDLIEHRDPEDHLRTALLQAAFSGSVAIVSYLIEKYHANIWTRDAKTGSMAVHLAAQSGHVDVVRYLCEHLPEMVEARDNHSSTPLFKAAQTGHLDVVKFLVDEKQANIESEGYASRTPLLAAAGEGHFSVVEFLVDRGAMTEAEDDENKMTAIQLASHFGHQDICNYLSSVSEQQTSSV